MVKGRPDPTDPELARTMVSRYWHEDGLIAHELDNLGIERAEDLRQLFEPNFYFGCEADDPCVGLAFDGKYLPFGARLKAVFSSDIGHWDVPDMTTVLEEAYELVEHGLVNEADFREFTFANAAQAARRHESGFFQGDRGRGRRRTTAARVRGIPRSQKAMTRGEDTELWGQNTQRVCHRCGCAVRCTILTPKRLNT